MSRVTRRVLRQQITDAWTTSIEQDYCRQRINSERSLQASFWASLNSILPPGTRRMFIEPAILTAKRFPDGSTERTNRCPDIVICNTTEVIGVIEVKYQPRVLPNWKKDLETLALMSANRGAITVSNQRYRGVAADERVYTMSDEILFVWAGVHIPCAVALIEQVDSEMRSHFLALHAETADAAHPTIRVE